jgi:hypothetical protein
MFVDPLVFIIMVAATLVSVCGLAWAFVVLVARLFGVKW